MTPEKVEMVQTSFRKVMPISDKAADIFYDRLFEQNPEVRPMFPADMSDQKSKLMKTLGVAVNNLHQVDQVAPNIKALGAKHTGYGVKDEHYGAVAAALLYTLEQGLGDDWTPELKDAWTETYVLVSDTMKAGAAEAEVGSSPLETAPPEKKGFFSRIFGQ